jgi:thiamine biosynthesis lipoprotein
MHDGKRYGHILDPRSGRPVVDAPLSISVSAATCSEAGTFSTLAMLHGPGAEAFLEAQGLEYRCLRWDPAATL